MSWREKSKQEKKNSSNDCTGLAVPVGVMGGLGCQKGRLNKAGKVQSGQEKPKELPNRSRPRVECVANIVWFHGPVVQGRGEREKKLKRPTAGGLGGRIVREI